MMRGFERPPWWASVLLVAATIAFVVLAVLAATRDYRDPLSPSQLHRIDAHASAAAASEAASRPKQVLFLGDSYSAGAGASAPTNRWTSLLAQTEGWIEQNDAFGGTGYATALTGDKARLGCGKDTCPDYDQALTGATATDPSLVIVSGGRNDLPVGADYAATVAAFFADLHAKYPAARIVATSPLWDDNSPPPGLTQVADAVRAGVQAVGGTYLSIGQPLQGHPEMVAADGIHPDDAGHKAIADAVAAALATAGIKAG